MKPNLAQIFAMMHRTVNDCSKQMLLEMKRHNYVTPTNYLELVAGYKAYVLSLSSCSIQPFMYRLLYEKRKELGDAASKLKNGLNKIDETRSKVEAMSVELEDAKTKVVQFQKQCEEYLVVIVQQKREADEQQKVKATFRILLLSWDLYL
jgi:dynein heavy chain